MIYCYNLDYEYLEEREREIERDLERPCLFSIFKPEAATTVIKEDIIVKFFDAKTEKELDELLPF